MTARLLTSIGRLWTGSEIISNAAILISDDRIAWVGPSAELPRSGCEPSSVPSVSPIGTVSADVKHAWQVAAHDA